MAETAKTPTAKTQGKGGKRTANLLFIRVSLALALLIVVSIGIVTGQIGIGTPWS